MTPRPNGPGVVLMTADPIGGVWSYALELAGGLHRAAGTRTVLATMGRPLSAAMTILSLA